MNKKRQKIVFDSSSVDDLLARTESSQEDTSKDLHPKPKAVSQKSNDSKSIQFSELMNHVNLSLSDNKTSTSYNISDSLLLAMDQACLELRAAGVRRKSTGRKVTRGHLVEVAIFHALQELQKNGLKSEVASLLIEL